MASSRHQMETGAAWSASWARSLNKAKLDRISPHRRLRQEMGPRNVQNALANTKVQLVIHQETKKDLKRGIVVWAPNVT